MESQDGNPEAFYDLTPHQPCRAVAGSRQKSNDNEVTNMERRFIRTGIELGADGQGDEMSISGYAAKWNKLSERLGNGSFR
jgi:hypothetical protein